jgi:hypothetical protein
MTPNSSLFIQFIYLSQMTFIGADNSPISQFTERVRLFITYTAFLDGVTTKSPKRPVLGEIKMAENKIS